MIAGALALLGGAWSRVQAWTVAAAALLAAIGAVYLAGRRGANAEAEARALRRDLRQRDVRDAVDRDVARERSPAERLRERWARD